ncbi:hypothetical protein FHX37_1557 [Haloactinospora alba]|uniref:Uncharacterized protein n=1 Tax=Haloactinospora alba TaxID=405555 RepID=A0A543NIH9_9ACTN|nr:hypothetical protein [Haloactinospora alba]TQN31641.1 hypothetical protein FHX37_1557 [Haloactinospora alba]
MPELTELVDLPDADTQPLVHPLDVHAARRPFLRAQLVAALTSPPVGLCLAGITWFAAQNFVAPLLAGSAVVGFGTLAAHVFREQAWAFIPRKRQDRRRALPLAWELGSTLVLAAVLAVALALVVVRLAQPDISVEVRQFTFGMAAVAGLLMASEILVRLARRQGRRALLTVPGVLVVAGSLTAYYVLLAGSPQPAASPTAAAGAGMMLVVAAGVGTWKYIEHRRTVSP